MDQYKVDILETQIQNEVSHLQKGKDTLHPEVKLLLDNFKPIEKRVLNGDDENSTKRIRLEKYSSDSDDISTLQSMHSYLDHQIITLNDNLNKTITNQWAVNNEYLENTLQITQDNINQQLIYLNQLNKLLSK